MVSTIASNHFARVGSFGFYHDAARTIWVRGHPGGCRILADIAVTLAHELAHAVTHDACAGMPQAVREVVAESVAYAVCSRFGLDLSLRSVDYVAGWGHPQGHDPAAFRVGMAAIHDGAASPIDAIEATLFTSVDFEPSTQGVSADCARLLRRRQKQPSRWSRCVNRATLGGTVAAGPRGISAMDDHRFDTLTKALAITTRRGALRLLVGGALGPLGWEASGDAAAHEILRKCKKLTGDKKRKCVKKARKHAATHTNAPQTPGVCVSSCGGKGCGDDGCGGSCGMCGGVRSCANGTCVCPSDTTPCGETACCRNADEQCCNGTCASSTLVPEGGACLSSGECCPGSTCTTDSSTTAHICCASGKSCNGVCCSSADAVCTPNDLTCCPPANVCFKSCCTNGTRCSAGDVCCASGNSCNGVCCPRTNDICTPNDFTCCRPERVCHKSCCGLDEFCKDGFICEPIVIGS